MSFLKKLFRILVISGIAFLVLSLLSVLTYRFLNPPLTPLMVIRVFQQASDETRVVRIEKDWVDLEDISPWVIKAAIASEDQRFESHNGFDFESIEQARAYNEKNKGKRKRGGSTISQQLAKNLFLWPARSWVRKGFETWFTFLIELLWSKHRIMEVYLNVIEMGDGVYGIEAAAREYFDTSAIKLNKEKAALIVACWPSPLKWSPSKPSKFVKWKKGWIIRQMNNLGEPKLIKA
ncbi:MAG: monofunctional biosynthetic peptidoglycan transglycosylase [Bacteroidota bacterium]